MHRPINDSLGYRSHEKSGFTLVELSIVLVILGLLVGGVLAGQSLIRAAQIRSVISDSSKYVTAVHAFRDKYFAIPGDMANATQFWGVLAGTGDNTSTCQDVVATGLPTCNGDGNGQVSTAYEGVRLWHHLANAGLIEGFYVGTSSIGTYKAGINVPATKLDNATWSAFYRSSAGNTGHFPIAPGNLFMLTQGTQNILKPEEAWNIDMKADDGMPGTGRIIPYKNTSGSCTTATNVAPPGDAGATYVLSATTKECLAMYWGNAY